MQLQIQRLLKISFPLGLLALTAVILIQDKPTAPAPTENYYPYYGSLGITPVPAGRLCWNEAEASAVPAPSRAEIIESLRNFGRSAASMYPDSDTGLAVQMNQLTHSTKMGYETYLIEANGRSVADFSAYNPAPLGGQTLQLSLIALLDETQIETILDFDSDEPINPNNIVLMPQQLSTVKIQIPELDTGTHELVLLWIRKPQTSRDITIAASNRSTAGHVRITLVIQESDDQIVRPLTSFEIAHDPYARSLNLSLGEKFQPWALPQQSYMLDENRAVDFYTELSYDAISVEGSDNSMPLEQKVAVLLFVDGIQTSWPDGQLVTYVALYQDDDYIRIPTQLIFPDDSGQHEITVVRVNYPGVPQCLVLGNPEGVTFNTVVTGITVYVDTH